MAEGLCYYGTYSLLVGKNGNFSKVATLVNSFNNLFFVGGQNSNLAFNNKEHFFTNIILVDDIILWAVDVSLEKRS